ncbi:MAG: vitamin K epoxide reductase family protein [Verrucomicrobiota bacterium]
MIILRMLAVAGFAISAWLLIQKLNGSINSLAGCGEGSGCSNVLGSRWSQIFHLPVSAISVVLYAGLLGLSFRPRSGPLLTIAILLLGAALWFTLVQALILKAFCPWCLATHTVGLAAGLTILFGLDPKPSHPIKPVLLGVGMLMALVVGQKLGPTPKTHLMTEETIVEGEGADAPSTGEVPENLDLKEPGRTVSFFKGKKTFVVDELPRVGAVDAPHVLVKYFDYTCGSCRDMHGDLMALKKAHPGIFTVILLPSPLDRSCNSSMRPEMRDHPGACDIARLALAVWRSKPEAFEAMNHELFMLPNLDAAKARMIALGHVEEAELEEALKDPWIEEQLKTNFADFAQLVSRTGKMPKLLVRDARVMHGLSQSTESFIGLIEKELGLQSR